MKKHRKRVRKINKNWVIVGILIAIMVGLIGFVRIKNLKKTMENDPVKKGEAYENFDNDKAIDLMKRYFEGMAEKDMDKLEKVFYTKNVLTTFAKYNEMSENQVIDSLKSEVEKLNVEYKDLVVKDYSAYPEKIVASYNEQIKTYADKDNEIEAMYLVSVNYLQNTTIGWEDKTQDIRVYSVNGEYYIWPNSGE